MDRKDILAKAEQCVCRDRQEDYGAAKYNFERIAELWSAYRDVEFDAFDVAMMMALCKIGRMITGKQKDDNFIDAAGYISLAGEIASDESY